MNTNDHSEPDAAKVLDTPDNEPGQPSSFRPRAQYTVWLLFIVLTLNIVDRQVINILAHPISEELDLADWQLGLLTGLAFAFFYNLSAIPLGRLADNPRTNRVWLISGAVAVWSTATAACSTASNFFHLVLARIGVASSESACTPTAHSMIADLVPKSARGRALAIFGLGVPLGALIGKAGGGLLTEHFGWRSAFLLVGLPGLVIALIFLITVKEPRRASSHIAKPKMRLVDVLKIIAKSPAVLYMMFGTAFAMFLVTGGSVWGMIHFLRNHGLSEGTAGVWLGMTGGIAGLTGTWLGGWLADKLGQKNPAFYILPAMFAMLLSVPFLFFAWWTDNWGVAIILLFLPDMFDNMYYGGTFASLQLLLPPETRATVTACFLFVTTMIGYGLGAFTFGIASDVLKPYVSGAPSESIRWVLMGAAILYLVPAVCYWRASISLGRELPTGSEKPGPA
ncbi:MFS transporter [Henriciella sp. AS95]|uniref:spinster family MFS transporter n=1 Tax=Henriciella sp. AS95 TaxID=3135782 RepID=UPI00317508B1